jgi:RNA polymerase sigma-70 factor (ECF subfamily)
VLRDRLARLLSELMPDDAEVWGLLALMLLHDARRAARVDEHGRYVALEYQDRALWDQDRIAEGMQALARAAGVGFAHGPRAGPELLAPLLDDPALERYQPLHATHAELLRQAGDVAAAAAAYERAIALSANAVERDELERRLQAL